MAKATWKIDAAHSLIEFSVKHLMIATVKGRFGQIEGEISVDPADLTAAEFNVTVDMTSIDTRDTQRDVHLKSADFFDAEQYPTMSFRSKRVTAKGDDEFTLVGDLTIHGVTKETTFALTFEGQAKDPWGGERVGFSATANINRKDFGLEWNATLETGGVMVGEKVKIEVHMEGVRQ
jgi:polyisoprenoid-binding protein YceI